jgi:hypothetical protein
MAMQSGDVKRNVFDFLRTLADEASTEHVPRAERGRLR